MILQFNPELRGTVGRALAIDAVAEYRERRRAAGNVGLAIAAASVAPGLR